MCSKHVERGFSLIELLVFIVIVGIAAAAVLTVMGSLTRQSARQFPQKQAQILASGMLDEILAQPYTFCDPDVPNASSAPGALACLGPNENNLAPESETRGGSAPFDNVNDYNGYGPVPVSFPDGRAVTTLPGDTVQVQVQGAGPIAGVPGSDTLRVTVSVNSPAGVLVRQEGVSIRYAPNT